MFKWIRKAISDSDDGGSLGQSLIPTPASESWSRSVADDVPVSCSGSLRYTRQNGDRGRKRGGVDRRRSAVAPVGQDS